MKSGFFFVWNTGSVAKNKGLLPRVLFQGILDFLDVIIKETRTRLYHKDPTIKGEPTTFALSFTQLERSCSCILRPSSCWWMFKSEGTEERERERERGREGRRERCFYNFTPNLFYNRANKKVSTAIYPSDMRRGWDEKVKRFLADPRTHVEQRARAPSRRPACPAAQSPLHNAPASWR